MVFVIYGMSVDSFKYYFFNYAVLVDDTGAWNVLSL
jgi:hypothetical protein